MGSRTGANDVSSNRRVVSADHLVPAIPLGGQRLADTGWAEAEANIAILTARVAELDKASVLQIEMGALAKVDSPDIHHWQQFHNQKFGKEQDALDARSSLKNTVELSQAYFSPGSPFLCYRFTAYDRLTMPVLIIGGKYDWQSTLSSFRHSPNTFATRSSISLSAVPISLTLRSR